MCSRYTTAAECMAKVEDDGIIDQLRCASMILPKTSLHHAAMLNKASLMQMQFETNRQRDEATDLDSSRNRARQTRLHPAT